MWFDKYNSSKYLTPAERGMLSKYSELDCVNITLKEDSVRLMHGKYSVKDAAELLMGLDVSEVSLWAEADGKDKLSRLIGANHQ